MSDLTEHDYNGECFVAGGAGEREEIQDHRVVVYADTMPFGRTVQFDWENQIHKDHLDLFFRLNYYALIQSYVDEPAEGQQYAPSADTAQTCRKVAYVRAMAARENMYDFTGGAAMHRVRYSEYEAFSWEGMQAWARGFFRNDTITITDLATARASIPQVPNAAQDRDWRKEYRAKHYDVVCVIAYMFRVRGHHWIEEMDDRYKSLWHKCLYDEDTPGLDWEELCHDALHAIYPDDLDNIWRSSVENGYCAGTLVKRFDSLPAGVAGISALNAGVTDLGFVVPKALEVAHEGVQHLKELTRVVQDNRWAGSVNRRFYNAPNVVVDEAKLAALASIIRAALENFQPSSPLLRSKALARIAANAAITGAVVGRMVMTATRSDEAARAFLPAQVSGT